MCTAFVFKGNDILCGYNLDVDPKVWDFHVYKTKRYFALGVKVEATTYLCHGVTNQGNFMNLPYMNDIEIQPKTNKKKVRIDLLANHYIRGHYDFNTLLKIVDEQELVNAKGLSMHSLVYGNDRILLLEPGYETKEFEKYAVVSNFPLSKEVKDENPFYGKDRYQKANDILTKANDDFSVQDGLSLLKEAKQEGQWATRVSFVYSKNENAVYYCFNNEFDKVFKHQFEK